MERGSKLKRRSFAILPMMRGDFIPGASAMLRQQVLVELVRLRTETGRLDNFYFLGSGGSLRLAAFEREKLTNCSLLAGNLTRGAGA